MEVLRNRSGLNAWLDAERPTSHMLGLVPTMGAIHAGHTSLVEAASARCRRVLATIFVNPLQFGETADFETYPRDEERDLAALEKAGCSAVWLPTADDLYPPDFDTRVTPGALAEVLEGEHRPGHFEGVCTVVVKLLNAVRATHAWFGQKDLQQALVLRRTAADLDLDTRLMICPIVRARDGLALSSRNARLSDEERTRALALHGGLRACRDRWRAGERDRAALEEALAGPLAEAGLDPDYAVVRSVSDLRPRDAYEEAAAALVAARVGDARLIDNTLLGITCADI